MGLLISWLRGDDADNVFLDLDNAEPSPPEKELYDRVAAALDHSKAVLQAIDDYKGCQDLARKAMNEATRENEERAFLGLLDCVASVKVFFDFAKQLEQLFPELLVKLSDPVDNAPTSLASQQALAKQLALLLDFILAFDQIRMMRPHLSNDFSYYRRLLPKFNKHPKVEVKEEEANAMALFTAEHIPMMSAVARASSRAARQNPRIGTVLVTMCNVCLRMVRAKRFDTVKTNLLSVRAMTGALVLFDHVDDLGAFRKGSPARAREAIQLIQREFPNQEPLLNAIRFSTKHFKDESTPAAILDLFA